MMVYVVLPDANITKNVELKEQPAKVTSGFVSDDLKLWFYCSVHYCG